MPAKFEDPVTLYVRAQIQAHLEAGGQLKDFVTRSGHPPLAGSAPSQIKDGKLGVGPRTISKWAKALGTDRFGLYAAAHKFAASRATVVELPTWEALLKNAVTVAQAKAIEAARGLDLDPTSVALACDIASRLSQSGSWPAPTWMQFFQTIELFDKAKPADATSASQVSPPQQIPEKIAVGRPRRRK